MATIKKTRLALRQHFGFSAREAKHAVYAWRRYGYWQWEWRVEEPMEAHGIPEVVTHYCEDDWGAVGYWQAPDGHRLGFDCCGILAMDTVIVEPTEEEIAAFIQALNEPEEDSGES